MVLQVSAAETEIEKEKGKGRGNASVSEKGSERESVIRMVMLSCADEVHCYKAIASVFLAPLRETLKGENRLEWAAHLEQPRVDQEVKE